MVVRADVRADLGLTAPGLRLKRSQFCNDVSCALEGQLAQLEEEPPLPRPRRWTAAIELPRNRPSCAAMAELHAQPGVPLRVADLSRDRKT